MIKTKLNKKNPYLPYLYFLGCNRNQTLFFIWPKKHAWTWPGFRQDIKNACTKRHSQHFCCPNLATQLLLILIWTKFNSLFCKKKQLKLQPHLRREDGVLREVLKSNNWKICHRRFCLSKKELFRKPPDDQMTDWSRRLPLYWYKRPVIYSLTSVTKP